MQHFLVAVLATFGLAFPAMAQERIIDAGARVLPFTIDDQPLSMEVTPDAPVAPVLSAEAAARLDLNGSLFSGVHVIGNTRLRARSNRIRIDFGDGERVRRRAFFFDQPWSEAGDGLLNPMALPEPVVTYRLREPVAGERELTFSMREHSLAGFHTQWPLGEQTVMVLFSLVRDETMATAAAGALLAQHFDGRMDGAPRVLPIEFGIERPVRQLAFARQPMLGELALPNLVVRTGDTGSTAAIPDDERDPNEIVVPGSRREPPLVLWVGLEALAACSSLSFDRPAQLVRLRCAPGNT